MLYDFQLYKKNMNEKLQTELKSEETCAICGKPLLSETWIDDEEYGDVHERCLEEKQLNG